MPIYEFECIKCNHRFEKIMKTNEPFPVCSQTPNDFSPPCAGDTKRLISLNNFKLKGGGWYADGYSKARKKTQNE